MAYEVIQINENTWRIEDNQHVRFFLLTGEDNALLIDSGMTVTNAKDIAEELTDLPIMLINTHGDRDHVASNHQFETFFMSAAEAANYYNVQKMTGEFTPIEDGDVIELGGRPLAVVSLPGHTPGSIGIIDVNNKVLFGGDPIQDGMIFMFGEQREMHAYRSSLEKISEYGEFFDVIYPSHGTCPVQPELIGELYDVSGRLADEAFPRWEMDFHGRTVTCVDTGVAKFLID